jgi:uncharacterized RDD family membrane protein YckC
MKPTAVVGRRVGAFVIDLIVLSAINAVLFFPFASTSDEIAQKVLSGELDPNSSTYVNLTFGGSQYSLIGGQAALYFLLSIVTWVLYTAFLPGRTGATLGKAVTGIRVVKDDGTLPAGFARNLVRQLLWVADSFPYLIPYLTGFVVALMTSRNQRIGDMVARTLVVKKEFAGRPAADAFGAAVEAPAYSPQPAFESSGFTPQPVHTPEQREPVAAAATAEPVTAASASSAPAADWYPDPKGEKRLRYWDGSEWTDHTAD